MFWFTGLPWEKPEDFWLNVMAGIPFLLFDVVIIVWLLPRAIEWRNDIRWQRTRLRAIGYLLSSYQAQIAAITDALGNVTILEPKDPLRWQLLTGPLKRVREQIAISQHIAEIEIQTALPILGPALSEEVLGLHHTWKTVTGIWSDYLGNLAEQDGHVVGKDKPIEKQEAFEDAFNDLSSFQLSCQVLGLSLRHLSMRFTTRPSDLELRSMIPPLEIATLSREVGVIHAAIFDPAMGRIASDSIRELIGKRIVDENREAAQRELVDIYVKRRWWNKFWGDAWHPLVKDIDPTAFKP